MRGVFDGTDPSGWIECELTLAIPDEVGTPDGGCCGTTSAPTGAALLSLLSLVALCRKRR